jgi:hypothetical protein
MYEWACKMLHNFMVDVRHRCDMCPIQNVNLMFGDFNTRPFNKRYENTLKATQVGFKVYDIYYF